MFKSPLPPFRKVLITSVIVVLAVIGWHLYFFSLLTAEIKREEATTATIEKINALVLSLSGYKTIDKDHWNTQVLLIKTNLDQNSHLKVAIGEDFERFHYNYEKEFGQDSINLVPSDQLLFLSSNNELIENILSQLKSVSEKSSAELITLEKISSGFQVLLFIILLALMIRSFYFFRRFYESSRLLLQRTLNDTESGDQIQSNLKPNDNQSLELSSANINELISDLHKKLKEKDILLKDNKSIISLLIKHFPEGLALSTISTKKIITTNERFFEIYGFKPKYLHEINPAFTAFKNKKFSAKQVLPERDQHPPKNAVKYKNQIIVDKDGTSKNIDIERIPVPENDLLISIIKNNSGLLELEKALTESQKFSKVIFETNSIGYSLVSNDGIILKANRTYCEIYGFTESELIGQHFSLLIPRQDKDFYIKVFNNRKKQISQQMREYKVVRKNGEIRAVVSSSEYLELDDLTGTLYSVIDITDTSMEEGKMMAAIEGGELGTWNINLQTGHNEVNEQWAAMLGYKKFEILPTIQFFESLIHPEDLPSFINTKASILSGEKTSFNKEIRLKCKNGDYKWVLDAGKVIKNNLKGQPILMAGSHIDIDKVKKKEFELLNTSDRLRRAQEMGMVGDWELELKSGSFNCSAMVFRILGIKKREIKFEEMIGHFHTLTVSKFKESLDKLIESKSSLTMEGEVFPLHGTKKTIRIIAIPILNDKNEVFKVMGIFQDITSIKLTENRLENTRNHLQLLSDNIPGGLFQLRVNGNLPPRVLYLSKGAENIWNLSREEVYSGNGDHLLQFIHPKDQNLIKKSLLLATKRLERLNIQWRTISNDGKVMWYQCTGTPITNPDNTITWNTLILDITDKKIAENKIKEQDEYMHVLTRHASDAIIACDLSGKVKFINHTLRDWIGYPATTIKPEDWPRAYHLFSIEEDRYLSVSEFSLFKALKTGKTIKQDFIIRPPGKPIRYVQSNGSAINDPSGKRIGAMVVLRDMTQKVQKELEISNAIITAKEKERTKIAAEIHDGITQALGVVAMNMKNLRYDFTALNSSEKYNNALNYLNNVIDQSRILAHTIMPNSIKDFGLIEAVHELVEQSSTGSNKKINFEHTEYRRLPGNKELHIFRVIQEGLGNALKHSEAHTIQIRLFFEEDNVRGSLQDDGKGFDIRKNYLKQGIGLISMRDRIKKMKGQFRIFSGKGTIIWFKIPVKYKEEENEKASTHFYS